MTMYFTKDHEWVKVDGNMAIVGITNHAAEQLGEVVFVEIKDPDTKLEQGGDSGVVESVKAASDIYAPVSGIITEVNQTVIDTPSLLNTEAEGDAWLYKMSLSKLAELADLMDKAAYDALIA